MRPHHQKVADEGRCRSCKAPDTIQPLDPAHVIPKSLGGKMGYDSVIPLCRTCHDLQHQKKLDITPLLRPDEHAEAARAIGIPRAFRYLTNERPEEEVK